MAGLHGLSALIALLALGGAPVAIRIDLSALRSLSAPTLQALRTETEALWVPHGVVLSWVITTSLPDPRPDNAVRVVIGTCDASPCGLGSVVFREDQFRPDGTLTILPAEIVGSLRRVRWNGRHVGDLPSDMRDALVGRAFGRVLAHELGHYVLASRRHAPDGLMKAEFRPDQLIAPSRDSFVLPETMRPLVRQALGQLAARQGSRDSGDQRIPRAPAYR
jgi:hypothetical protein